jgi:hypothetical protein
MTGLCRWALAVRACNARSGTLDSSSEHGSSRGRREQGRGAQPQDRRNLLFEFLDSHQTYSHYMAFMSCWIRKGKLVTIFCAFPEISLVQ